MSNIYKGMLGLIGNTPLVEVANIEKELGLEATVLVKLEYMNPAGTAFTAAFFDPYGCSFPCLCFVLYHPERILKRGP